MFVSNGTVVVYSDVNGADVFTAREREGPLGIHGLRLCRLSTRRRASTLRRPRPRPTSPGGVVGTPTAYVPLTKVTVLTLANGTAPVVTRESWFEAAISTRAASGTSVRSVFQGNTFGPTLKYSVYELQPSTQSSSAGQFTTGTQMIAALEQLREANYAIIDASVIGRLAPLHLREVRRRDDRADDGVLGLLRPHDRLDRGAASPRSPRSTSAIRTAPRATPRSSARRALSTPARTACTSRRRRGSSSPSPGTTRTAAEARPSRSPRRPARRMAPLASLPRRPRPTAASRRRRAFTRSPRRR